MEIKIKTKVKMILLMSNNNNNNKKIVFVDKGEI